MLFVDVRIIWLKDDDLTIAVHRSNHIYKDYCLQISENIPIKEKGPVGSRIVVMNRCHILPSLDVMPVTISRTTSPIIYKFYLMCGTIRGTLCYKTSIETKLKFLKIIAILMLAHGVERGRCGNKMFSECSQLNWNSLTRMKGFSVLDQIRNEDIGAELMYSANDKIRQI